jgi:hypothetical protein
MTRLESRISRIVGERDINAALARVARALIWMCLCGLEDSCILTPFPVTRSLRRPYTDIG